MNVEGLHCTLAKKSDNESALGRKHSPVLGCSLTSYRVFARSLLQPYGKKHSSSIVYTMKEGKGGALSLLLHRSLSFRRIGESSRAF